MYALNCFQNSSIQILVISDPQLVDRFAFNLSPWIISFLQIITDLYINKSIYFLKQQNWDYFIFLGDYSQGLREVESKEFMSAMSRLHFLFPFESSLFVVGNHDIGYGNTIDPLHLALFKANFGPTNWNLTIGKTEIIAINSLILEEYPKSLKQEYTDTFQFINSKSNKTTPYRILLTHEPLDHYNKYCGTLRWHKDMINNHRGYQYKNSLEAVTSDYLLTTLKPNIILSGDDHDYCEIKHKNDSTEYTLPTINLLQGNLYPGVGILRLGDNPPQFTFCNLVPWFLVITIEVIVFIIFLYMNDYWNIGLTVLGFGGSWLAVNALFFLI